MRPDRTLERAQACARLADEKKAADVVILAVGPFLTITEYFVIASGNNRKQVQAIADEIRRYLKREGRPAAHIEGHDEGRWILIDGGDVVVHLFQEEARRFYDLEFLWQDAERADWN